MLTLFLAELRRRWSLARAYPAEEIIETVIMAVFFYMLFLGASFMAGGSSQFGSRLDAMVVGYVAWILMMHIYAGVSHDLSQESSTGTLEQIMLTPFGVTRILLMRSLANTTISLVLTVGVALIVMLLTGSKMHVSPEMVLPIGAIIFGSTGLGFMIGSLVYIFKQIRSFLMIVQFAMMFVMFVPIETFSLPLKLAGCLLPIVPASASLRVILVEGQFDVLLTAAALLNALFYLLVGMAVFRASERRAKRKGMVGAY